VDIQVEDLLAQTRENLKKANIRSLMDVRNCKGFLVGPGSDIQVLKSGLEAFLRAQVYQHPRVLRMTYKGRRIVRALFDEFIRIPKLLPERYQRKIPDWGLHRVVCDYLAGMTDRFAQTEYLQLFEPFHLV
jgi:dGTPase